MPSSSLAQYEDMLQTLAEKAKLALLRADISDAFNRQGRLEDVLQAFFARHPLSEGVVNELAPIADGIAQWIKRKQAETALGLQQELLDVTLRSIGDAVLATDIKGCVTFLNPVAETLTGWKLSDAMGKPSTKIFNILNAVTRQPSQSPVEKALREKRVVGLANHTILVARDGTERPIDDSGAPIRHANGEIAGAVLVFRDAGERQAASLAAERLAAIVHNSDDAIIGKSLSGIITNWNEGARRIFGYSAQEIVGKSIMTLIPPDLRDEEKGIIARIQQGQRIHHFETVRLAKDGRRVQLSITISPIRDADGTVIGASKIARDITERKQVEQALKHAQQQLQLHLGELEQRVGERTESLRKNVAELEAFSYSLSHDMRAPLRAVQSYLQIFLEDYGDKVDKAGLAVLHKVIASAQRMDRMVLDLLTFTRLSHEEMTLGPVDVEKLARRILDERVESPTSPPKIIVHSPLAMVTGNAGSLNQCLTNLLDNAVKFVAPGERARVEIRTEQRGKGVRIWVQDHGIGINTEEKSHLFKMFERLHGNDYPGTGIGLAIVHKAAERMGGSAGVESEPGKGSQFWLDLPGVDS